MESQVPDVFLPLKDYIVRLEDFDLLKIIGRGTYGEVYYAVHKITGTKAAIKKLLFEDLDDVQLSYFVREVYILAYYHNYFLVRFLGFSPFFPHLIITEYVPWGSLYDALHFKAGSPKLSGTDKTKIALGIIEGMICLHSNRVIHRDLKSLNILLDERKLPKICDFGISRAIDEDNQAKMTLRIGTFHWMAPEMLDSDDYDYKVDVYAFAIILWEMITGSVPYKGQDPVKILLNVSKNSMRPQMPDGVNEDLKNLVVRCWDQDPDVRPTFAELYVIFREQEIHFDDSDMDEIHRFFDEFPVSEELLKPKDKDKANNNRNNVNIPVISENDNDNLAKNEIVLSNQMHNEATGENQKTIDSNLDESKDSSCSEEEEASSVNNINLIQPEKIQIDVSDENQKIRSNTLKPNFSQGNIVVHKVDLLDDDKKEQKEEKPAVSKKDEKSKSKEKTKEKEKKKEKKKRKSEMDDKKHALTRRMTTLVDRNYRKKSRESIKFDPKNAPKEKQIVHQIITQRKSSASFDKIYDAELTKHTPFVHNSIQKVPIVHKPINLNGNEFEEFFDTPKQGSIPFKITDFSQNYCAKKDENFFLKSCELPKQSDVIDLSSSVFENYDVAAAMQHVNRKSIRGKSIEEEEEDKDENNEEEYIYKMLKASSRKGQLINIFKAELDEMTNENAVQVFGDLQNLIKPSGGDEAASKKDDVYIYFLSNALMNKKSLIRQFNDVNGFEMLPVTGNHLVTQSFVNLFATCIAEDALRFPFVALCNVFNADKYRNARKFILLLQAVDFEIVKMGKNVDGEKMAVFARLLAYFFENESFFAEFVEFPQTLFSIFQKVDTENDLKESLRKKLIDVSCYIIERFDEIPLLKCCYRILLADEIALFSSTESFANSGVPLETVVRHVKGHPEVALEAVSLIARLEKPPVSRRLLSALSDGGLWNCVEENGDEIARLSCLVLCRIALTNSGSRIMTDDTDWMRPREISGAIQASRAKLCMRLFMTLFAKHFGLRDALAKSENFWKFVDFCLVANLPKDGDHEFNFDGLVESLKAVLTIVRRIGILMDCLELLNKSNLVFTICDRIIDEKMANESRAAVEVALEILDILSRATARSADDNDKVEIKHLEMFRRKIPGLLRFGGVVAHKTLVAALAVFITHPLIARELIQIDTNTVIIDALEKADIIDEFEKYRVSLLQILRC